MARLPGVLLLTLAGSGCYRTTSIAPTELDRIEPLAERKLSVTYSDGTTEVYAADRARIESRAAGEAEVENPFSASVDGKVLKVSDAGEEQRFTVAEVNELELEADAPDRPWVIAGVTLGAAVLGGFIGAATQSCNEEWGCIGPAIAGAGGVLIGIPVGLAFSIPLSAELRPDRKYPYRASGDW